MTSAGGDGTTISWEVLEGITRQLHAASTDRASALDAILGLAVDTIGPARDAGVILMERGRLLPQAATASTPHELDVLQQATGIGPCVEAAEQQIPLFIEDTRTEERWPEFARRAHSGGIRSMLCVPLWIGGRRFGTLSVYSPVEEAFTADHLRAVSLFAASAAAALDDARQVGQLSAAVQSRDVIGQAKGILMERRRLTSQAAFDCLVLASQSANVKLAAVADHLVNTGELIGVDVSSRQIAEP